MTAPARTLRGDRNECPTCGEYFNSTKAFDRHRTGRFGVDRRCRTVAEITALGMVRNEAGFGVTQAWPQAAGLRAGATISDPEGVSSHPAEETHQSTEAGHATS